jgi:hypothetical protein
MGINRALTPILLALAPLAASADDIAIQRSVIQRDQQSAEFAARVRGEDSSRLEQLHARQLTDVQRPLHPDPELARQLQPYQRQKMADERTLVLPPPTETLRKPSAKPLPLPGGPRPGVELVPPQSPPN